MADKTFIQNKLEELISSNPEVNEIFFGKKTVSGTVTDEDSFVFGVTEKVPLSELDESSIIPSSISSGSVEIKTDVIETGKIFALNSLDFITTAKNIEEKTVTVAISVRTISGSTFIQMQGPEDQTFYPEEIDRLIEKALNGGRELGIREGEDVSITVDIPSSCPDCYDVPVNQQASVRPLQGGIQIGASEILGVGTLGFLALDNTTGALVGVTNAHVTSYNVFKVSDVNPTPGSLRISAGLPPYYYTAEGQTNSIGQPTKYNTLGPFLRFKPLRILSTNKVDGAIFGVNASDVDINQSFRQYGLSWSSPLTFATTAEIDSITTSTEIYSTGRTTGPKEGDCGLRVDSTSVSSNVSGYKDFSLGGGARVISFTNLLRFRRIDPACPYPINSGDSGSALIANFGGTWKIIGLCFAGSTYYGYACRIDNVASELGISAWTGGTPPFIDPTSLKTFTVNGRQTDETISHNGQTYHVIGTSITDGSEN